MIPWLQGLSQVEASNSADAKLCTRVAVSEAGQGQLTIEDGTFDDRLGFFAVGAQQSPTPPIADRNRLLPRFCQA